MPSKQYWLEKGLSPEEAQRRVEEDVFGVGFRRDKNGRPVEQGIALGEQHFTALEKAEGKEVADLARAKAAKRGG